MQLFGHEIRFWVTVGIAAFIKYLFSTYETRRVAVASLLAAVFCPWLFTAGVLDWWQLAPETYKLPVAGLLAWFGEQVVKAVLGMNLDRAISIIKEFRK